MSVPRPPLSQEMMLIRGLRVACMVPDLGVPENGPLLAEPDAITELVIAAVRRYFNPVEAAIAIGR